MNRTPVRLFILTLTTALIALVLTVPAQAAPYCGITWGSLAKAHTAADAEMLHDVRAGRHACFDRLVFDVGGQDISFGSYDVRYVSQVYSEGKGIPSRCGARPTCRSSCGRLPTIWTTTRPSRRPTPGRS